MWIVSLHTAMYLVCPRRAEASLSLLCAVQRLQDLQLGVGDLLTDQLGDFVSLLNHKLCVRMVKHHDTGIAPGWKCGVLSQLNNMQFALITLEFLGGGGYDCGGSFCHRHCVR